MEEEIERDPQHRTRRKILNEDHYGLEKIKDRILEFLAVRQLVKNPKGSFSALSDLQAWQDLARYVYQIVPVQSPPALPDPRVGHRRLPLPPGRHQVDAL